MYFKDEIILHNVSAGKGGSGCVSFLTEKFKPKGGPDGGDGGNGGNVYIQAHSSLLTLNKLEQRKIYKSADGDPGQKNQKKGKKGKDLVLEVPLGTHILKHPEMSPLADLSQPNQSYLLAKGGLGGRGNKRLANSVNQAPLQAQPGKEGQSISILLHLKLLADVGFLGLPNVGKSTLLNSLTAQHSKTAAYSFTTLQPYLGVLQREELGRLVIADIPGIIAGASKGHGLGLSFLRHIERVTVIAFVLDIESKSILEDLKLLLAEAKSYNSKLLKKDYLVILNKADLIDYDEAWLQAETLPIRNFLSDKKATVIAISALKKWNLLQLEKTLYSFFENTKQKLSS